MSVPDFDRLALNATADVVAFAGFVAQTEFLFDGAADSGALQRYQAAWFDAEITNALALDRWDAEGRPAAWDACWRADFQHDAAQALAALQAVVALYFSPAK